MNDEILSSLEQIGNCYIVGSRAVFIAFGLDDKIQTKDTDIIVKTKLDTRTISVYLEALHPNIEITTNSCEGLKLRYKGKVYDVWKLEDTRIYEEGIAEKYATIEDVINAFGFNIYQVAITATLDFIMSSKFEEYRSEGKVELVHNNIRNYDHLTRKSRKLDKTIKRELTNIERWKQNE